MRRRLLRLPPRNVRHSGPHSLRLPPGTPPLPAPTPEFDRKLPHPLSPKTSTVRRQATYQAGLTFCLAPARDGLESANKRPLAGSSRSREQDRHQQFQRAPGRRRDALRFARRWPGAKRDRLETGRGVGDSEHRVLSIQGGAEERASQHLVRSPRVSRLFHRELPGGATAGGRADALHVARTAAARQFDFAIISDGSAGRSPVHRWHASMRSRGGARLARRRRSSGIPGGGGASTRRRTPRETRRHAAGAWLPDSARRSIFHATERSFSDSRTARWRLTR